jgi:arabinofuranosyltransferase
VARILALTGDPATAPAGQTRRSTDGAGPGPNITLALAVLAVALLALGLHARYYMPFLCDDALISLRYAKRLIDGHGLTWNPGERVEGYSNLLWVLSVAALGRLGVDLIGAVRVLGFLGMAASLAAVLYASPPASLAAAALTLLVLLFLSLSGSFAVWAIGGMEQPLVAALLAWAVVLCYPLLQDRHASFKGMLRPGLLLGLLCLTRPDAPLYTAALLFAIVLIDGVSRAALRKVIGLAALPVFFCLAQLAFRLYYYGEWVPNTALVKFHPSLRYALDGWRYVRTGALTILPLLALAAASVLLSLRSRFHTARMTALAVLALTWTTYLILIGGDIFPGWRHFVPLLILCALMTVIGAEWIARHAGPRLYAGAGAIGVLLLGVFFFLQMRDPWNVFAISERWEWQGRVIGTVLKKAFGAQQPLLAVDAAGSLPYFSELPSLDMLGLNDHYLPRHPPRDSHAIGIGHDLGDGQYVLARAPDLVVFGIATGGERGFFRSAREMQEDPRFSREYTLVLLEGTTPFRARAKLWVRRSSERIGIRSSRDQIVIPGFLMNEAPGSVARLGGAGTLILPISSAQPARLSALRLPRGRWRIEAPASGHPLQVKVSRSHPGAGEGSDPLLDTRLPAVLDVRAGPDPGQVSIEVVPAADGPAELERLVFTRAPD